MLDNRIIETLIGTFLGCGAALLANYFLHLHELKRQLALNRYDFLKYRADKYADFMFYIKQHSVLIDPEKDRMGVLANLYRLSAIIYSLEDDTITKMIDEYIMDFRKASTIDEKMSLEAKADNIIKALQQNLVATKNKLQVF